MSGDILKQAKELIECFDGRSTKSEGKPTESNEKGVIYDTL